MSFDVSFTGRFNMQPTILALKEHAHAIRGVTYSVLRSSWVSDVRKLLSISMPALRNLSVSLETRSDRLAVVTSNPNNLVHLDSLELWSCRVPVDRATYDNLQYLKLCHCEWSATFDEVLDTLASALILKELVRVDCCSAWRDVPPRHVVIDPSHRSPVTLPALRRMQWDLIRPALACRLLACLRIPIATHVDISTSASMTGFRSDMVWSVLPPDPPGTSPIFSSAIAVTVGVSEGCSEIVAETSTRYFRVRVPNDTGWPGYDPPRPPVTSAVDCLLDFFRDAPVRVLNLSVDSLEHASQATWERVFREFDSLERLELDGMRLSHNMFSALRTASEPGHRPVCCPRLVAIKIEEILDNSFDSDSRVVPMEMRVAILDALRLRAKRGARLEKLKLTLGHSNEEGGPELGWTFLNELKGLVSEVNYTASGHWFLADEPRCCLHSAQAD
ncbi:hypothetical protein OH76DRAFT_911982 [Lentinus brumalis]|uniref:F-box domain-containing protein n=1 Tax=Lentinus brumalis TaxID=2498619 RepID=A0A371D032_9APHY|nr:hypothetical protein OH76DRAFT_911982 [Polyporus brumalis]